MPTTHQHQEIEINYLPSGTMTYLIGGEWLTVPEKRLGIFWAAAPHQVVETQAETFFWFTVPVSWLLQWQLKGHFIESILQGRLLIDESPLIDDADCCQRWHDDLISKSAERRHMAQLEIEARLRRFIFWQKPASQIKSPKPKKSSRGPDSASSSSHHVKQMTAYIAMNYQRKIRVDDIARVAGLHPNYAITLFRRTCGYHIVDYIVEHRIFHARRLLTTTDSKIIDIALDSGFQSLSRFYDAFQRLCKMSPRKYRLIHGKTSG